MGWAILALVMSFVIGGLVGALVQKKRHDHDHDKDDKKKDHKESSKIKGFFRKLGKILSWLPKKIWGLIKGKKQEKKEAVPVGLVEEVESLPKMEAEEKKVEIDHARSPVSRPRKSVRDSGVRPR